MRVSSFSDVEASAKFMKMMLIHEKAYGIECRAIGKAINTMNKILIRFEKFCDDNDLEMKFRREGTLHVEFVRITVGPKP